MYNYIHVYIYSLIFIIKSSRLHVKIFMDTIKIDTFQSYVIVYEMNIVIELLLPEPSLCSMLRLIKLSKNVLVIKCGLSWLCTCYRFVRSWINVVIDKKYICVDKNVWFSCFFITCSVYLKELCRSADRQKINTTTYITEFWSKERNFWWLSVLCFFLIFIWRRSNSIEIKVISLGNQ